MLQALPLPARFSTPWGKGGAAKPLRMIAVNVTLRESPERPLSELW